MLCPPTVIPGYPSRFHIFIPLQKGREREGERERERETERETERDRETDRDRETERQTERERMLWERLNSCPPHFSLHPLALQPPFDQLFYDIEF